MALINARASAFTYGTSGSDIINASYLLGDQIDGLAGNDTISGLDGPDTLLGGAGRDVLYGLGGHDVLDGGAGNDKLYGGAGNDILRPDSGGIGDDLIDGGSDWDTVDYSSAAVTRGVRVDLRITTAQKTLGAGTDTIRNVEMVIGTSFNDRIIGTSGDNHLFGGVGCDSLDGGDGNDGLYGGYLADLGGDTMNGGNGDDLLSAGNGADVLSGGAGNDRIYSRGGADLVSGGLGSDRFIFQDTADSNASGRDRILDFDGAEDLIVLEPLFFVINSRDTQFIGSNAFSMSGVPEIRVTSNAGTQLVEVDTTGNGGADMAIEVVGTALALDDFFFDQGYLL